MTDRQQEDEVGDRPRPGVAPRRHDDDLRHHHRDGADGPEAAHREPERDRARQREARCREPRHAPRASDRLRELRQISKAKGLRKPHQVDESVHQQNADSLAATRPGTTDGTTRTSRWPTTDTTAT